MKSKFDDFLTKKNHKMKNIEKIITITYTENNTNINRLEECHIFIDQ